ncbi:hypothetical protein U9M48_004536, partial [Paspalum notatum var. saurae]
PLCRSRRESPRPASPDPPSLPLPPPSPRAACRRRRRRLRALPPSLPGPARASVTPRAQPPPAAAVSARTGRRTTAPHPPPPPRPRPRPTPCTHACGTAAPHGHGRSSTSTVFAPLASPLACAQPGHHAFLPCAAPPRVTPPLARAQPPASRTPLERWRPTPATPWDLQRRRRGRRWQGSPWPARGGHRRRVGGTAVARGRVSAGVVVSGPRRLVRRRPWRIRPRELQPAPAPAPILTPCSCSHAASLQHGSRPLRTRRHCPTTPSLRAPAPTRSHRRHAQIRRRGIRRRRSMLSLPLPPPQSIRRRRSVLLLPLPPLPVDPPTARPDQPPVEPSSRRSSTIQ